MRKVIAAINMTVDGICDHTAGIPDEEIHDHYTKLLSEGDVILYGRTTYQLMGYWQTVLKNPTGNKAFDDFAIAIDRIPKIVFSHTLEETGWESATLAKREVEEEVFALKRSTNNESKPILVGSPGLILSMTKLNLIDEYQLCIHPVIAGKGMRLFKEINDNINLKLLNTKIFGSGAVTLYYEPSNKKVMG